MQISWISRQGRARLSNNDAAAFGRKDQFVLAILVDAAEKGDGQGLARHWSRNVIDAALGEMQQLSLDGLIKVMRAEQQQLRYHHLHAIASYCCVLVDVQQRLLHIAYVGDCLVGIKRHGEFIDWQNRPQNLLDQAIWPGSCSESQESRHLLTRCLNAKRFSSPDCLTTHLPADARLLLCSDGYWHDYLLSGIDLQSVTDDASVLSMEYGNPAIEQKTDCDNLWEWILPQ